MTSRRVFTQALAAGALIPPTLSRALAQDRPYPHRTIQLVIGFPPGNASDIGARLMATRMSEDLKQTVYVDNKPGAAGIIAHQFVKNAPADGYSLIYGSTGTLAINPTFYRKLPYDPLKDFAPVVLINSSPMFLVAAAQTSVSSFKEMVLYVKARPGKTSYGSSGNGVTQHIAMEMLKKALGLDILHVPYKGSPQMITDLIGGQINFAFDAGPSIVPHVKDGRVRALAVSATQRTLSYPTYPRWPNRACLASRRWPGWQSSRRKALRPPSCSGSTPQPTWR